MPRKTTPPQPKPAPPAAEPQSNPTPGPKMIYGASGLVRVHRLLRDASKESRDFFEKLMSTWERCPYNLPETALMESAGDLGYWFVALDFENQKEYSEDLRTLYQIYLDDGNEWLKGLLRDILHFYRAGTLRNWTPEDALWVLKDHMDQFQDKLDFTRKILEKHPETVAAEIEAAAKRLATKSKRNSR